MDNSKQQQPNPPRSISAIFQQLFLPGRDPSYVYWLLGAITLIAAIIRLWRIAQPIAYDEAYTFVYYATRDFKHILADYSAPNNHIFHTILVRIFYEIFGRQTWVVRGPALLAGILCVPAAFFFARRIFNARQALAGAALVALTPWFINYSVNGRGYSLIILFSLLLANIGALLTRQQSRTALGAYAIIAALGFYTIPIFLYPMAGVSLWVLVTHLTGPEPWKERSTKVRDFLLACLLGGLLTLLFYLPVILFGTGFRSITSNEIVEFARLVRLPGEHPTAGHKDLGELDDRLLPARHGPGKDRFSPFLVLLPKSIRPEAAAAGLSGSCNRDRAGHPACGAPGESMDVPGGVLPDLCRGGTRSGSSSW